MARLPAVSSLLFPIFAFTLLYGVPVKASPSPVLQSEERGLLPILDPVLNLLADPPPKFLQARDSSPDCATVNGGEMQCCRGTVAGDLQLVVWLADLYGYKLNPNDINGLDCDNNLDKCPGVKVCCQVTAFSPLLSLWCQAPSS